jgi:hypothetical protein
MYLSNFSKFSLTFTLTLTLAKSCTPQVALRNKIVERRSADNTE